jgi:hypothetical protein
MPDNSKEEEPSTAETTELLGRLNHWHPGVRKEARKELRGKTPAEILALMQAESARRLRQQISVNKASVSAYLGASALCFAGALFRQMAPTLIGLLVAIVGLSVQIALTRQSHARSAIAKALETRTEPAFLFAALEALANGQNSQVLVRRLFTTGMGPTEGLLVPTIKRLLPTLRADQAALMTAEQRAALYAPLNEPYFDPQLTIALLRALEQVGDYTALATVRKLASARATNIDRVRVKQMAERCLPALERAEVRAIPGGTLLRPASSAEEELLRPAGSGVSEEAVLVRPFNR